MSRFSGPATPLTTSEPTLFALAIGFAHAIWIAIVISIGIGFLIQFCYKIRKQEIQPVYMYSARYILRVILPFLSALLLLIFIEEFLPRVILTIFGASILIFIKDKHKRPTLENIKNSFIYEPLKICISVVSFMILGGGLAYVSSLIF